MKWIGIDPGVHTGFAVWDKSTRKLTEVETYSIHKAMRRVLDLAVEDEVFVIFEDARQRKWFGDGNVRSKQQGAGSIKRDCGIWDDFLTDYAIGFRAVPPAKGMTKWSEPWFKKVTGWKGRTSNHGRDAAALVFGK